MFAAPPFLARRSNSGVRWIAWLPVGDAIATPDVCLTPAASGADPIPYTNDAMNAQATGCSETVKVSMMNAMTLLTSVASSNGDEAGTSSANRGKATGWFQTPNIDQSKFVLAIDAVRSERARMHVAKLVERSRATRLDDGDAVIDPGTRLVDAETPERDLVLGVRVRVDGRALVAEDAPREREEREEERRREEELHAQVDLIARQQRAIVELSTPIIQVWDGVLTLPLVGFLDAQRAADLTDRLLNEVSRTRARYAILDLTGVETIDTATTERLLRIVGALRLLGAKGLLSGMGPAIAQSVVALGVDLSGLASHRTLKDALHACIAQAGR